MVQKRKLPTLQGKSVAIFREAVRSPQTWLQYERRFYHFLHWLGETPDSFLEKTRHNKRWGQAKVIEYILLLPLI